MNGLLRKATEAASGGTLEARQGLSSPDSNPKGKQTTTKNLTMLIWKC